MNGNRSLVNRRSELSSRSRKGIRLDRYAARLVFVMLHSTHGYSPGRGSAPAAADL